MAAATPPSTFPSYLAPASGAMGGDPAAAPTLVRRRFILAHCLPPPPACRILSMLARLPIQSPSAPGGKGTSAAGCCEGGKHRSIGLRERRSTTGGAMASTSRLCSDEELQKARDDLREVLARSPIADEFKPRGGEEKEGNNKVGKKKKMYVLPKEEVDTLLSYKCSPIGDSTGCTSIDYLKQVDEELYGDLRTMFRVVTVFKKHLQDSIHATQEKIRREVETKGYYAYEATDDEEEDNVGVAVEFEQEGSRAKRHRSHPPGIVKQTGA